MVYKEPLIAGILFLICQLCDVEFHVLCDLDSVYVSFQVNAFSFFLVNQSLMVIMMMMM